MLALSSGKNLSLARQHPNRLQRGATLSWAHLALRALLRFAVLSYGSDANQYVFLFSRGPEEKRNAILDPPHMNSKVQDFSHAIARPYSVATLQLVGHRRPLTFFGNFVADNASS